MFDEYGGSSEDELPDIDVIIRQYQHKVRDTASNGDAKKDAPVTSNARPQTGNNTREQPNPAIKATPLRRRKLGQTQAVDGSLLKPWNGRATKEENGRQQSNSGGSRVRARGPNANTNISSKSTVKSVPANTNKAGLRAVSPSAGQNTSAKEKPEQNGANQSGQAKNIQLSEEIKELVALMGELDDEESDILGDKEESSEEGSEFITISDSESDTWNSDSEVSSTQPTRRSKSPNDEWARPQRTLFASPDKKTASRDSQTKKTITDPTKHASKPRKQGDSHLESFRTLQPGNLEDAFQKLQM